jgi:hypothetical protein
MSVERMVAHTVEGLLLILPHTKDERLDAPSLGDRLT